MLLLLLTLNFPICPLKPFSLTLGGARCGGRSTPSGNRRRLNGKLKLSEYATNPMFRVPRALLCSRLPPPIPPPYPKPSPNPFPPLLLLRRPVEWLMEAMAGSSKLESLWLGRAIVLQRQRNDAIITTYPNQDSRAPMVSGGPRPRQSLPIRSSSFLVYVISGLSDEATSMTESMIGF